MPSKFLNADDTVDLIKYGTQNAALQDFENINDADAKILIKTTSANQVVTIDFTPFVSGEKIINWGDGNTTTVTMTANTEITINHTYEKIGYYIIRIPHIIDKNDLYAYSDIKYFQSITPKQVVIKVIWTTASKSGYISSFLNCFDSCTNLIKVIFDRRFVGTTQKTEFILGGECFKDCTNLEEIRHISKGYKSNSYPNYTQLTLKYNVFLNCINLKHIDFLDTVIMDSYTYTFKNCQSLCLDNLSKITYGSNISNNGAFEQLNLNKQTTNLIFDKFTIDISNGCPYNTTLFGKELGATLEIRRLYLNLPNTISRQIPFNYYSDIAYPEIHITNTSVPTLSDSSYFAIPATSKIFVPASSVQNYKSASGWSDFANRIFAEDKVYLYTELDNKLSTTGGALTGDITTTNTTFTSTSLVTKDYVDTAIANIPNGNSISY